MTSFKKKLQNKKICDKIAKYQNKINRIKYSIYNFIVFNLENNRKDITNGERARNNKNT